MSSNKQTGFGFVNMVVAIAVCGLLLLVLWRVVNNPQPQTGRQADTADVSHKEYLRIAELGVQVTLDARTRGTSYVYQSSSNSKGDAALIVNPSMKAIDNGIDVCNGVTSGQIGILQRSNDPYYFSAGQSHIQVNNTTSFKMGEYYFMFETPQAECSQDSKIAEQRAKHQKEFTATLKTLQTY